MSGARLGDLSSICSPPSAAPRATPSTPTAATSTTISPFLPRAGALPRPPGPRRSAPILASSRSAASRPPRRRGGSRRCGSSTASSLPRAARRTDPTAAVSAPKRGPRPARRFCRSPRSTGSWWWRRRARAGPRPAAAERLRAARMALPPRTPLRDGAARLGARGTAAQRPQRPAIASSSCAARAAQRAPRAPHRGGAGGGPRLSRPARGRRRGAESLALPRRQRQRPSHPPGLRPRPEDPRRGGFAPCRPDQPACPAPRLRQPPPSERRGPARRAGAPRPFRHLDDADLHPCPRRAPEEHGPRPAPAGRDVEGRPYACPRDPWPASSASASRTTRSTISAAGGMSRTRPTASPAMTAAMSKSPAARASA